jgi:hypothetical protein
MVAPAQDMNAVLQGVSEGEKQRFMVALEEMQMKEQVIRIHGGGPCWRLLPVQHPSVRAEGSGEQAGRLLHHLAWRTTTKAHAIESQHDWSVWCS